MSQNWNLPFLLARPEASDKVTGWQNESGVGNYGYSTYGGNSYRTFMSSKEAQDYSNRTGESVRYVTARNPKTGDVIVGEPIYRQSDVANKQAENLIRPTTNRTLELLRQNIEGQRRYGTANIRSNLARQGMLDSGSLSARLGRMNSDLGNTMAQGWMHAANKESDALLQLLMQQKQLDSAARMANSQRSWQEAMAKQQQDYERSMQPQWWQYLLGGAGQGVGTGIGMKAAGIFL